MNHGETKEVKSVNHLPFVSTKRCVFLGGFVVPTNLETQSTSSWESMQHTIGRNPPPVDTVNTLLLTRFYTSQVVQDHQQYGYPTKDFGIFPRKTLFRIAGRGVVVERQTNRIHSVVEKDFWIPDDPPKKNFHPFTCRTDFPNTASKRHHLLN